LSLFPIRCFHKSAPPRQAKKHNPRKAPLWGQPLNIVVKAVADHQRFGAADATRVGVSAVKTQVLMAHS
ncbi:MAG: hypothetical protein MUF81_15940, partial [Verrucomicrobia bacterium]|nr:hypothetical protein [Verrucomicrobiota bacterium]